MTRETEHEFFHNVDPNPHEALLQQARRLLPAFYEAGNPEDATWFEALIPAHVALTEGMLIPREIMPAADRANLERDCDRVERSFMEARDQVWGCSTFRALAPGDRSRISAVLFELFPPRE